MVERIFIKWLQFSNCQCISHWIFQKPSWVFYICIHWGYKGMSLPGNSIIYAKPQCKENMQEARKHKLISKHKSRHLWEKNGEIWMGETKMDNIKCVEQECSFLCFAKHVTTPILWRKHFPIGCWIIVELLCDPQLPITPFCAWVCKDRVLRISTELLFWL